MSNRCCESRRYHCQITRIETDMVWFSAVLMRPDGSIWPTKLELAGKLSPERFPGLPPLVGQTFVLTHEWLWGPGRESYDYESVTVAMDRPRWLSPQEIEEMKKYSRELAQIFDGTVL